MKNINIVLDIFSIIVIIFICFFSIRKIRSYYKSAESNLEKALYDILTLTILFIGIVYALDRFNIPSILGYTENIDSSDWVNNITNYAIVIFSTLLNSAFLIFVTRKQIQASYEDNIKLNKQIYKDNAKLNNEAQRIQNMPFLRYSFIYESLKKELFEEDQELIFSNQDDSNSDSISFTFEIENIGLNAVRKTYLEIESELFDRKEYFELCNQSNVEKNEKKSKEIMITNVAKGTYGIKIFVYYQDLLKNWYKQQIDLVVVNSDVYNEKYNRFDYVDSFVVYDEVQLKR